MILNFKRSPFFYYWRIPECLTPKIIYIMSSNSTKPTILQWHFVGVCLRQSIFLTPYTQPSCILYSNIRWSRWRAEVKITKIYIIALFLRRNYYCIIGNDSSADLYYPGKAKSKTKKIASGRMPKSRNSFLFVGSSVYIRDLQPSIRRYNR